jgi:hypothetical protein
MLSQNRIYMVSDGRITDELERIWKEALVTYSGYNTEICLDILRKTIKFFSKNC